MDRVESLAIDRAKKLFKADHANVQPHSGTTANLAVYLAAIKPGRDDHGHEPRPRRAPFARPERQRVRPLLSGGSATPSGRTPKLLDYDQIRQQALTERPADIGLRGVSLPRG